MAWKVRVVLAEFQEPMASVDTFGRRICGGAMRPPGARAGGARLRFAGRLSTGGRAGPSRSVGGRAGPLRSAAADGSGDASVGGRAGPRNKAAAGGKGAGAGGIASSLLSSSEELP